MNFELLKRLSKNVVDEQSLFSWLQFYSVQTWNKLEFVRSRKNLKLTETTVTQNLVFDFWQLAMATRLPVEIYESNAEKLNGNDLEVFVETPKGYISMPCQAKLVQKNNKYSTISHKRRSNSSLQINLLIEYAKKNKGIPIYFLYNYCSNKKHCKEVEELSGTEIENYGITVINANYICKEHLDYSNPQKIKFKIPSFRELHPYHGSQIHQFIKLLRGKDFEKFLSINYCKASDIKFYNRYEIFIAESWTDLAPLASIGFVPNGLKLSEEILKDNKLERFMPRYRILFPIKRRELKIYK